MKALLKIESLKQVRSMWIFALGVGMPLIFFLIFSSTIDFGDPKVQAVFVRNYMLTMTSFSMSSFALFTFPLMLHEDRKNHWTDFLRYSPISSSRYYLSKIYRVFLTYLVSIPLVFSVGALVRGVSMSPWEWGGASFLLILTSIVYLAIGLLIGLLPSEQSMSVVANICFFILAILGGSWMPISVFPEWVQRICKFTPGYHVNQAVLSFVENSRLNWKSLAFVAIYTFIFLAIVQYSKQKKEGN